MATAMVACGGSDEPIEGRADGLYRAFDVLTGGHVAAEVRAIVGSAPDRTESTGTVGTTLWVWEREKNTYRHTTLIVLMGDTDGLLRKSISGYDGSETQSYQ
ncbi:hypothetical protein [Hydrogenophaga sp. 5NK40-0174]|uniref:hypothetical protein n=1 Tax=Hydrogenophaga sp. 5NK40-0174 TaxID=3127649 RepID=UPI00333E69DD